MEFHFRQATETDKEEIVRLYIDCIRHLNDQKIYQWDEIYPNEEVLSGDIMKGEMHVMTEGNRVLACVVLNEFQDETYQTVQWKYAEGRIAVIHRLCVNYKYQGMGIGRRMMQNAEALLKDSGYSAIRLDVFPDNSHSIRLYEKLGYLYAGDVHFRKGRFFVMEKSCETDDNTELTDGGRP